MTITPEMSVMSFGMMYFFFIFVDEFLFWKCVNRYISLFGLDFTFLEVGSGWFLFMRLLDYDKHNRI